MKELPKVKKHLFIVVHLLARVEPKISRVRSFSLSSKYNWAMSNFKIF